MLDQLLADVQEELECIGIVGVVPQVGELCFAGGDDGYGQVCIEGADADEALEVCGMLVDPREEFLLACRLPEVDDADRREGIGIFSEDEFGGIDMGLAFYECGGIPVFPIGEVEFVLSDVGVGLEVLCESCQDMLVHDDEAGYVTASESKVEEEVGAQLLEVLVGFVAPQDCTAGSGAANECRDMGEVLLE